MKNLLKISGVAAALAVAALPALAQDAPAPTMVPTDVVWILNTVLFLIGGFLVFWMAAGFAMLEAGLVRSKNVTMQLLKNVILFAIACTMYYLIGYNLMYRLAPMRPAAIWALSRSPFWRRSALGPMRWMTIPMPRPVRISSFR